MSTITQSNQHSSFVQIANDLELKALSVNRKQYKIDKGPLLFKLIRNFFNPENDSLIALGKSCQSLFDQVEKVATIFTEDKSQTDEQNQSYAACLKTAKAITSILSLSKSNKVKAPLDNLMLRVAALQYRIEGANGGLDRSAIDPVLTEKLCDLALEWKNKHSMIVEKRLTPEEIQKMERATTYPEFTHVLLGSRSLKDAFFNWVLRDNNDVSLFVEFPATSARIKSTFLASRIGRLGLEVLRNRMPGNDGREEKMEKNVVLPFFNGDGTEFVSVLDESRGVHLNGGLNLTVNEVFKVFSRKNREIGNLEIFKHGIMNWNSHQHGSLEPETGKYDRVDLTKDNWYKQLPVLLEMTKEDLEKRVGDSLESGEWVVFAKASRTTPDLDLDGRHGFFELAIPTGEGIYGIYPFGIFPEKFPHTAKELISFLGNTFRAKVAYPDENFFYSHRQQAEHPLKLTEDEARGFMKVLQKELIKSRYGHAIFQFGAENCAYWSQKVLNTIEAKKHNFYKTDYVESHPLNPVLKWIFGFFRSLPKKIRNRGIIAVDLIFGTGRGIEVFENRRRVFKSHKTSQVRNEFVIYQPGHLHRQIMQGEIKGRVYLGAC